MDTRYGFVHHGRRAMGVNSGLPDFRGPEAFWKAYPGLKAYGLTFSHIASPHAFHSDARLAWGFYGHWLALYRNTVLHEGFHILRRWADVVLGEMDFEHGEVIRDAIRNIYLVQITDSDFESLAVVCQGCRGVGSPYLSE